MSEKVLQQQVIARDSVMGGDDMVITYIRDNLEQASKNQETTIRVSLGDTAYPAEINNDGLEYKEFSIKFCGAWEEQTFLYCMKHIIKELEWMGISTKGFSEESST